MANKHYLQVTDAHFSRAVKSGAESGAVDTKSGVQVAHFPAQQPAATSRIDTKKPLTESGVTRSNASECGAVRYSKAPRGGHHTHRGFVEPGAFGTNKLRQTREIVFYPWNTVSAIPKPSKPPQKQRRDPMRLARYYQSLLDSGKFESRAALARHLGVSRARVTQVLNRLKQGNGDRTTA